MIREVRATLDQEGPNFEFLNVYKLYMVYMYASADRFTPHQKWNLGNMNLETFVKKFDINRHYKSSKWGTTYFKYFHQLIEKYPRADDLYQTFSRKFQDSYFQDSTFGVG